MNANPPDPWVLVGRIGKAHGLDGSVRVWPEADLGEIFDNQVPLKLWLPPKEPVRDLEPLSMREQGGSWVVRWKEVDSREDTLSIRNGWIVARKQDLPEPKEDYVYWNDLLGAAALTHDREPVGVVVDVQETLAQTVVEIEREDGVRFLLPLSVQVDARLERADSEAEANRLVVHLPEGMIEATTVETIDRPRRRERRGQSARSPRGNAKESGPQPERKE